MLDYAAALLILAVASLLVGYRQDLAKLWFRSEDPRTLGLFRIALGGLLLGNLISLAPLHEYLFASEGLMTAGEARTRSGEHRFSLLYEFGSIEFVTAYTWTLWLACAAFTVGLATPVTKWVTWFLYLGLLARIGPAWQGDHVFAGFLFYLCFSHCGESFSLDAWIRRIRDPALPRHRAIPAWPRNLMLLQMIPVMCANGLAKTGELWREGDMFYAMLNDPMFQPFPMWEVSAIFGTNLFRVMTWVTHAFEILFPLVLVGLVADLVRRLHPPPPSRRAVWVARALLLVIGIDILYIAADSWVELELAYVLTIAAGISLCLAPLTLVLARRIPERARRWLLGRRVWTTLLVVFSGVLFFVMSIDWFTGVPMVCAILLFEGEEIGQAWVRSTRRPAQPTGPARAPEPSSIRRHLVATLFGFHVLAVAAIVLPHAKPVAPWRETAERPLKAWVIGTIGTQHWKLVANGDRRWVAQPDLELMVQDGLGNSRLVGDGILPVDDPRALDRRQQIRQRLRSNAKLRAHHADWVCRHLDAPHAGVVVIFYRVSLSLPSPEQLASIGPEAAAARVEASRRVVEIDRQSCD